MPRHIQPREVAELKGAVKHDPQRYRKTPPIVEHELGVAPDHMSEAEKAVWFEIQTYAPKGVLKGADRMTLELLAVLFAEFRQNPKELAVGKYGQILGCLARLGMTPSDRQKLGTEKPPDGNPFETF